MKKNAKGLNKSLFKKSIASLLFLGLIPLLVFGLISIININDILTNDAVQFEKEMVRLKTQYIMHLAGDTENLVLSLEEAGLKQSINNTANGLSVQSLINHVFENYKNKHGLLSLDIFSPEYKNIYHIGEPVKTSDVDQQLLKSLYSDVGTDLYWSGIEQNIFLQSKYKQIVLAAKRIKYESQIPETSQNLLVLSYDPEVFSSSLFYKNQSGVYSILADVKKRIVYHSGAQTFGPSAYDEIYKNMSADNGTFYQTVNGSKMLFIYTKLNNTGWYFADYIRTETIFSKHASITTLLILLILLAILLILFFGLIVNRQIVLPIHKVIDTFKSIQNGQRGNTPKLKLKSKDEIGELGNLFNSFIDTRENFTMEKELKRRLNIQNKELQDALEKLRNTQSQMLQQEKLAGIGQLAAGVAHEINNPLGYVSGNADMLNLFLQRYETILSEVDKFRKDPMPKEHVDVTLHYNRINELWQNNKIDMVRQNIPEMLHDITEGLKRIGAIVNGLRSFSRNNQIEEKSAYNLNEGIKTTLLVANNEIKYNCDVELAKGDIPDIYANGGQINQVLLNIIINATHAIKQKFVKGRGVISIKTFFENKAVFCEICDNGCGMTEDIKRRMFEPFFTTKPVGQGTGLGLGIVYDIVCNKHGGKIDVETQPGKGTCFTFSLPADEGYEEA